MKKTKLFVCDSHFLCREGLKSVLNKNPFYEVVNEASSQEELERKLDLNSCDIVVLDYADESKFGLQSITFVQEIAPLCGILIISDERNKRNIYDVLSRGISHYITKTCKEPEIYKALDACRDRQKYFCPKILDIIIDKTFGAEESATTDNLLTTREKEIVELIAKGKMAKEISGILNISIHTIYTHRKNIMNKLEISSPVELITYAINTGIVQI
jgi:DNA-binding NarL/FixJ family response regulator